ncbi:PspC domain-containing protein [Paenibacillus campi]|uniref:PspC domain-containing protein n=1 Tax=Paenibacillus campi TaxID=3106031 RepID=UPI002AFEFF1E|nr:MULTISPECIES: PspC domain-containing protein [unclassified Paenibacillus]
MKKWHRSSRDKVMTGLIGGLAEKMGWDASLLRILFVISVFLTSGTSLLIYLIAALFVPKEYPY